MTEAIDRTAFPAALVSPAVVPAAETPSAQALMERGGEGGADGGVAEGEAGV